MLPLYIPLLVWLALVGVFFLMSALAMIQMYRYAIPGMGTLAPSFAFVAASAIVLFGCAAYFVTVNWSSGIDFSQFIQPGIPTFYR